MEPPSFSRGNALCTVKSVPLTLRLNILSKCSSVIFPNEANSAMPALAKKHINPPLRLNGLVETIKVGQFGNISLNPVNTASDSLNGFVEFLLARPVMKTYAPSLTKSLAVAKPIPSCRR